MLGSGSLGTILFGGSSPKATPEAAVRRYLIDIVPEVTKVYYQRRPQTNADLPCVILSKDGEEERIKTFDVPVSTASFTFTFAVVSTDPEQTTSIYQAIRDNLDGFRGVSLGRVIDAWIIADNDAIEPPNEGSDDWYYNRLTQYEMLIDD